MRAKLFLSMVGLTAAAACGDSTGIRAGRESITDTLSVFALSGTPLSAPTALNTVVPQVVRADPSSNYDVVFDITTAGQAVIYPPAAIGAFGRAGLQKSSVPFDELLEAPVSGYDETTPADISPGDVVLIRAASVACAGQFNLFIYSKLAIDSVNVAARTIHFRIRVDPNCGFRSFAEGIPEN